MKSFNSRGVWLAAFVPALFAGCEGSAGPMLLEPVRAVRYVTAPEPAGLVPVTSGVTVYLWPYTGTSFAGVGQDPINLVFTGSADPRNVRNALLGLDGLRAGPFAPFDCSWRDAIGGQQATYTEVGGWSGSVIQLECGDYDPFRFHIRLFPAGEWTVANAHVDVLIPGTTDHQVLSWEFGEQLVAYDLQRGNMLTAVPGTAPGINAHPTFRSIAPQIYNGLPLPLRALTGGPLTGPVSAPIGIPTDGSATILALRGAPPAAGTAQDLVVAFGQFIPKPFCNEGGQWLRVDGPVRLRQSVQVSASGVLTSQTFADGALTVQPFDPATGQMGPVYTATVRDHYHTLASGSAWMASSTRLQEIISNDNPLERLQQRLQVGPEGQTLFHSEQVCGR